MNSRLSNTRTKVHVNGRAGTLSQIRTGIAGFPGARQGCKGFGIRTLFEGNLQGVKFGHHALFPNAQPGGKGTGGEAGAAGKGFGLHALFKGAHLESAIRQDGDEVGICAHGSEGRVVAIARPLSIYIQRLKRLPAVKKLHEMARTRVQEPSIQGRSVLQAVYHTQAHFPKPAVPGKDFPGMHPVSGNETENLPLRRHESQEIGKGHDAAAAVAAHHPRGAVGIIELHTEVKPRFLTKYHQPVGTHASVSGTEAGASVAQGADSRRIPIVLKFSGIAVTCAPI